MKQEALKLQFQTQIPVTVQLTCDVTNENIAERHN